MSSIVMNDPSLFENAAVGIAIVDSVSGKILAANTAYCALIGRDRERVVGKTWMRFTHYEDISRIVYVIYKMHETKEAQAFSGRRYVDGNGGIVHADVTVLPFHYGGTERAHLAIVRSASSAGSVAAPATGIPGVAGESPNTA
jgi:PAS domain S-box-containing protein